MSSKKTAPGQTLPIVQRNTIMRIWLRNRDLFNIAALCRRINYDRGNFSHFLEGHSDLTEEYLSALETALVPYGYQTI